MPWRWLHLDVQTRAPNKPAGSEAVKAVKTDAVRQESVRRTLDVVGTLAAEDQVSVSSEVDGVVRRVLADLGDRVASGQTLVEIDREKLQYNLDQQRAAHARALTKYGASDSGHLPRVEDTPDVRRAAAELEQARQGFERASALHKRQLISQQLLDDADTTLRLKRAAYDAALQEVRNLQTDIDASAAAMKLAERQLRDASIRAPFDGYIQQRMVSLGELVKAQMPVMTVVRVDPLKLRSEIPERMAPWVKVGQPLTLRVDAFPDRSFAATVSRISPAVTTADAHVCLRSARAECRGAVEAGHVRPRAARDLPCRTGDDDPVCRHAVPLRRLPGVHRRGRSAGGARAQDGRPRRRPHGDPRRTGSHGSGGGDGRRYADRWDEDYGGGRVAMLSELCVRRPVFATMLVMSLVVLGLFSFRDLGVDLFPKADPAQVNVSLRLPGAAPDEMTSAVIMPMENALSGIAGIDQMTANVNTGGNANIQIRFVLEADLEDAANAVREKVAGAMRTVPPETLPPVVQKQDPDADPIMSVMLSSKTASLRTLTEIADKQVKRALESVNGVGAVTMNGDRSREIHIVVDVEKLNAHGLSIDQVVNAIRQENVEIPGGTLEQGKWEVGLRTLGRIEATEQFNNVIVATVNGVPLRVSDIGYAEDSVKKVATSLYMADGSPGVQLDIRRASGENTITVIEGVKERLQTVRQTLPPDVTLTVPTDDSRFIYASIASLEEHLIWGSLLASLVVLFFIRNLRAVIIASVAIPASIIATFTLMRAMDFTLNNMTLLALTLAVGIVIDDAIVVLENIFRYIEEKQYAPFDAAIQGTREVALPVMATTLSLIVIFLPVAFMTGYARRFIYPFGWTMAFAILVSMVVSFTLTPMLSSRWLKASPAGTGEEDTKHHRLFRALDRWYTASLRWTLAHPMRIIGISIAVVALAFPLNRMVGRTFVPAEDMNEFTVHADTPQGTSIEGTTEIARNVVKEIGELEGVSQVAYIAGADRYTHFHILFYLQPSNERKATHVQIMTQVRRVLARHPAYAASIVGRNPLGGGGNFQLQSSLLGPDLKTLYEYSQRIVEKAKQTPSLVDAKSDYSDASPEVQVAVDRSRAADLGVRMATIGNTLRLMVAGDDEITTYREAGEQYPVTVRVLESQRRDINMIGKLTVTSASGQPVRIDNIARLERGFGPTRITRSNRQYAINMNADTAPGHALDESSGDLRRIITEAKLPPGYTFQMRGQTQNLDETTDNLILAIALASIFVYMVLAAQFESFVQPLVIMTVLPLSVPFALFTIWATGRTLNLWSALGILLLFGIVKKNSILQVDYTNVLRARGVPRDQAIVDACRTRLRPILMTTLAIIFGLLPTALGVGIGGAQRSAIAVTIIGAQSLCLFLTLLLVPAAYVKLDALEQSLANQRLSAWLSKVRVLGLGRRATTEG